MTAPKVAVRLGTEGKEDAKRDFREYGDAGDAAAARVARGFDKASQDVESALRRQAAAAQKIAAIMPQTAAQMQINDSVGTGSTLNEGSARVSAAAFRELFAEQERLTAGAAALRAQLDPAWAAQQRFNNEIAQARTLVAAGAITLDEYCAKLRVEEAALEAVSNAQAHNSGTSGAMRAGMQQLGFQAQDFTVQVLGGTDAIRAFAMQAPQAIGALQLMANSTEGGAGKFARFASILAGPVGIAIGVAIPLVAMLGEKFFSAGDDAQKAGAKVDIFTAALNRLAAAQGRVGAQDLALSKIRVAQLQGQLGTLDQRIATTGGTRANVQLRNDLLEQRSSLQNQLTNAEATVAGAQIAWDNRIKLDALGVQDKANAKSQRDADSAAKRAAREGEREREAQARASLALEKERNGWLNSQVGGSGARDSLAAEGDRLSDQQKLIRSINDDISAGTVLLNVEWETRGKSRQEIEAAIELKRFEIDLQRQGLDLSSEAAKDAIARKASQISFNQILGESVDKMEALRDIGSDAISKLLDPSSWTSWKSLALGAISDVTQAFWKLAVINPIQNKISGGALPTIGNLFGLIGSSSGVKGENVLGSAIGNNYTPAGAMLVGENGPEIVNMPRGAQVMTASDSRRMMAGQGNSLQVRVIKGDLFDVEVAQISAGVSADTVATAAPLIAVGASNGAQQAVAKRNGRRLA